MTYIALGIHTGNTFWRASEIFYKFIIDVFFVECHEFKTWCSFIDSLIGKLDERLPHPTKPVVKKIDSIVRMENACLSPSFSSYHGASCQLLFNIQIIFIRLITRLNLPNMHYVVTFILVLMFRDCSSLLYLNFVWSCAV